VVYTPIIVGGLNSSYPSLMWIRSPSTKLTHFSGIHRVPARPKPLRYLH